MTANDGVLSEADFAQYTITRPAPVQTTYRGYTVYGMPPPSSGGVHVIQILNMLEARNLKKINPRSADFFHLISESMKLAFADRAHWLGDAAFAKVPRGLMDKGYARKLAARIHPSQIIEVKSHGIPPKVAEDIFDKHTTHFSCADSAGNWVAITATINTHFGSKVVIPGTGVLMNNEMDDFAAAPGAPNAFGLLGAEANSVEPGKRPLSSMSPTLVLKETSRYWLWELREGRRSLPRLCWQWCTRLIMVCLSKRHWLNRGFIINGSLTPYVLSLEPAKAC